MSFIPIVEGYLNKENYQAIDLSTETLEQLNLDASVEGELQNHFIQQAKLHPNKVFYGGYLEKRNLYQGKQLFAENEIRNIHLGIDFWAPANTGIICPFEAEVVVSAYNEGVGDYGGTIILKHQLENRNFYTLYGHLSKDSLQQNLKTSHVQKGNVFCRLGEASENGGYVPHLHFQVILELDENNQDYPGVCSQNKLLFYQKNCPNPLAYLGFKN